MPFTLIFCEVVGDTMTSLKDKTLFITGASRGIGRAIALRAARDGANIVIAAKTAVPAPRLPGTIHETARDVEAAGGKALPVVVDVRKAESVQQAVAAAVERFGGIDILVNNASAIALSRVAETPVKRFDLMFGVNVRGSFLCAQACLPHLLRAENPHVLTLAPPLSLKGKWFAGHATYTTSKYAMAMLAWGLAEEYREQGLASNTLWPRTLIGTVALNVAAPDFKDQSRKPEIMAEAAWHILTRSARECTGQFFIDEEVLRANGVTDFTSYRSVADQEPMLDLFIDP